MKRKGIIGLIMALSLLSCATKQKKNTQKIQKPVYIDNVFPEAGLTDPHNIIIDGRLYVFCGHDQSWDTEDTWKMDRWEIHSTTNLIDWRKEGEILPTQTYIGDKPNCWAGDIVKHKGKYYWYFSNRNHDTGVMVADKPNGPFKDALGKPLLPNGIIGKQPPYDPEIFVENGVSTVFFSAGRYCAATLNDDMISLASKPKHIKVLTKDGKEKWTEDKSTVFKRGAYYYLVWGANYAMSKKLYGPYTYQGNFVAGGHNSVFQWHGQWYALSENKDISLFYRGVSLKPFYFNADGTVKLAKNDNDFPHDGRQWSFKHSVMGWKAISGGNLKWDKKGLIKGDINNSPILESAVWASTNLQQNHYLKLKIKNTSNASKARISIATYVPKDKFWTKPNINWKDEVAIEFNITPNSNHFENFSFDLSKYPKLKPWLKRLRLEPALNTTKGSFEIKYIGVENKGVQKQ